MFVISVATISLTLSDTGTSLESKPRVIVERPRAGTAILLAATVLAGLASRAFPAYQPRLVAEYAGDTLWAVMAFWGFAFLRPGASTRALGAAALALAALVEFSQLIRAPWLDAVRATLPGRLALGQGFLWSDLACYAVGAALAMAIDRLRRRRAT